MALFCLRSNHAWSIAIRQGRRRVRMSGTYQGMADDWDDEALLQVTKDSERQFKENQMNKRAATAVASSPSKRRQQDVLNQRLHQVLYETFGYRQYRPGQLTVLQALVEQKDVAVFWATGSGKSICYQIPALMDPDRMVLVISPLISLMEDQVAKLNGLGSNSIAALLGSGQTDASIQAAAWQGAFRILYVTPELFGTESFQSRLARLHTTRPVSLVAVDEAHCVSEWGHDFRPDYRRLGTILRNGGVLQNVPVLALTATAVPRVQQDIVSSLQLAPDYLHAQASFDRPNLAISMRRKPAGGVASTLSFLLDNGTAISSTIIYAASRNTVDEICASLQQLSNRTTVQAYHAGLSTATRSAVHTRFLTGQTPILVATVAFGMGIDKPDIRRVIHYGPPKVRLWTTW
jgi:ATP-dependent DNA helicase RecQ